ncbi:YfgM family protein [Pasteurellaceae bacterium 22721_9_1]
MAYTSLEEQELNEIKSWWKENYKTLIAAAVLGFGGVTGWNYWQSYQANKIQETAAQYDQIIYSNADEATQKAQIDAFVKENSKTAYATFALLEQAKVAVTKQDYVAAEQALSQAVAQSPDSILASIAAIRLAEVQLQQQQWDKALQTLTSVKDTSWDGRKALITGEIQLAKGDKAAAKQSFETAIKSGSDLERQEAQVRLNNL